MKLPEIKPAVFWLVVRQADNLVNDPIICCRLQYSNKFLGFTAHCEPGPTNRPIALLPYVRSLFMASRFSIHCRLSKLWLLLKISSYINSSRCWVGTLLGIEPGTAACVPLRGHYNIYRLFLIIPGHVSLYLQQYFTLLHLLPTSEDSQYVANE